MLLNADIFIKKIYKQEFLRFLSRKIKDESKISETLNSPLIEILKQNYCLWLILNKCKNFAP